MAPSSALHHMPVALLIVSVTVTISLPGVQAGVTDWKETFVFTAPGELTRYANGTSEGDDAENHRWWADYGGDYDDNVDASEKENYEQTVKEAANDEDEGGSAQIQLNGQEANQVVWQYVRFPGLVGPVDGRPLDAESRANYLFPLSGDEERVALQRLVESHEEGFSYEIRAPPGYVVTEHQGLENVDLRSENTSVRGTSDGKTTIRVTFRVDTDGDGIADSADNCPSTANRNQDDVDGDGVGDACDSDIDGDDIANAEDNCPRIDNENQEDMDKDGAGDLCDDDRDGDLIPNSNEVQTSPDDWDTDNDGLLDGPDRLLDLNDLNESAFADTLLADGIRHRTNGSVRTFLGEQPLGTNPVRSDTDGDGLRDAEEIRGPTDPASEDTDGDGVTDGQDAFPSDPAIPAPGVVGVTAALAVATIWLGRRQGGTR